MKSLVIQRKLFELPEFQKAKTILFYASCKGEVETFSMMNQAQKLGKTIALPCLIQGSERLIPTVVESLGKDLEQGLYGILQPKVDPQKALTGEQLDMVIVPGVAFDRANNRLGRGGGYYDRFLKELPRRVLTVGLAFDFQIIDQLLSQEGHDVPVARVLTN